MSLDAENLHTYVSQTFLEDTHKQLLLALCRVIVIVPHKTQEMAASFFFDFKVEVEVVKVIVFTFAISL